MSHWSLSLLLLVLALLPFALLWRLRKSGHDGWLYLLASLSILFFTAALLVWAPDAYLALGGTSFIPTPSGDGVFDTQSYSGFLQVLFGMPVAVAGSVYAILLARQSERQSSQFNAYEIKKNFRDRLETRGITVGRFARSLRDINNAAYILLAQVERTIAALPEDAEAAGDAAARVRKEVARIDDEGLPMVRKALEDYRDAAIAVQESRIVLDKAPRPPLDTIRAHFYADEARHGEEFIGSLLARDYQAVADRFVVRAYRLGVEDLIRARLERMAQSLVRWSDDPAMHAHWNDIRAFIALDNDLTGANVSGESDFLGFRFIGPALIRADSCPDALDPWKLRCRVDLGTAILVDSCLALPSRSQSEGEIAGWDEWRFLAGAQDEDQRKQLLASIPDRADYFPHMFDKEVGVIRDLYAYAGETSTLGGAQVRALAASARSEYRALFYHMPPDWMDVAYDELAGTIAGGMPPSKRELADRIACLATGIQLARINNARGAGMAAVDRIVGPMDGAVERQMAALGASGHRDFRRCLLVRWALHGDDGGVRGAVLAHLQALAGASDDTVLSVELQLDLCDCHAALGDSVQAAAHFARARALLEQLPEQTLNETHWFGRYPYPARHARLEAQTILLSLWLRGFLMKQAGDYTFGGSVVDETEIAMPNGFLPAIWTVLVKAGHIVLPGGAQPQLLPCPEDCYFDRLIAPGQGEWIWEPGRLSAEIGARLARAGTRGPEDGFLDEIYRQFQP
jgi:hypothetical protein